MDTDKVADSATLLRMMTGYWVAKALNVAAELGVADLLRDGPRTIGELASACGAHPPTLYRLLRALASQGVFAELGGQRFELTPLAELLRSDGPDSKRALARMYGASEQFGAWADLMECVRTGEPSFAKRYGTSAWEYRSKRPDVDAVFNEAMTGVTTQVADAVVAAYNFDGLNTVVDVGGGHGVLMATILRAHPRMRGVLIDLPRVIAGTRALLEAAGVAERCETVALDFFESVPPGGDAYILAQILHDWDDEQCNAILRNCRRAMRPRGRLLVIEQVMPPNNEPSFSKWLDLHMLVMLGGRERTRAEYGVLLGSNGLELVDVIATRSGASIVEAVLG
jgi:ubiquinone/menaquinone biosynthesis C-methylase UbiE